MEKSLPSVTEPTTEAEYEAGIDVLLSELDRHGAKSALYLEQIERFRAEIRTIAAHTDRVLASIRQDLNALQKAG